MSSDSLSTTGEYRMQAGERLDPGLVDMSDRTVASNYTNIHLDGVDQPVGEASKQGEKLTAVILGNVKGVLNNAAGGIRTSLKRVGSMRLTSTTNTTGELEKDNTDVHKSLKPRNRLSAAIKRVGSSGLFSTKKSEGESDGELPVEAAQNTKKVNRLSAAFRRVSQTFTGKSLKDEIENLEPVLISASPVSSTVPEGEVDVANQHDFIPVDKRMPVGSLDSLDMLLEEDGTIRESARAYPSILRDQDLDSYMNAKKVKAESAARSSTIDQNKKQPKHNQTSHKRRTRHGSSEHKVARQGSNEHKAGRQGSSERKANRQGSNAHKRRQGSSTHKHKGQGSAEFKKTARKKKKKAHKTMENKDVENIQHQHSKSSQTKSKRRTRVSYEPLKPSKPIKEKIDDKNNKNKTMSQKIRMYDTSNPNSDLYKKSTSASGSSAMKRDIPETTRNPMQVKEKTANKEHIAPGKTDDHYTKVNSNTLRRIFEKRNESGFKEKMHTPKVISVKIEKGRVAQMKNHIASNGQSKQNNFGRKRSPVEAKKLI